jgi:hypothetical protein
MYFIFVFTCFCLMHIYLLLFVCHRRFAVGKHSNKETKLNCYHYHLSFYCVIVFLSQVCFSLAHLLLSQWWTPPRRLQFPDLTLSLWCMMFLVWQFCREPIECCAGTVSRVFFKRLLTIVMDPMITFLIMHFISHVRWIYILRFLYFNFFSAFHPLVI